ncbi:uncharacterized protein ARMOST_03898 [Armillaria ostoyae]|uniref:Uncharacterized protein n=1 Tax=Armillaria ostoyae TaxID=47428 RepID=A0A284QVS3_ARMOS|nr:uncharacterized protein ARMOST_03898 [Armillaria ostoyae]
MYSVPRRREIALVADKSSNGQWDLHKQYPSTALLLHRSSPQYIVDESEDYRRLSRNMAEVSSPKLQSMDSAKSLGQWESCLARNSMEKQSSIYAYNSQSKETVVVKLVGIVAPYEQAAGMNDDLSTVYKGSDPANFLLQLPPAIMPKAEVGRISQRRARRIHPYRRPWPLYPMIDTCRDHVARRSDRAFLVALMHQAPTATPGDSLSRALRVLLL